MSDVVAMSDVVCHMSNTSNNHYNHAVVSDRPVLVCLSAFPSVPKQLKVRTSNLAGVFSWTVST